MTNIELLKALSATVYKDDEDEPFQLTLLPPATETELQQLAAAFPGGQLPAELADLLRFATGWQDPYGEKVAFSAIDQYGYENLVPLAINLGPDGLGNCWLLEITPGGSLGKVFFACHDPAVLVIAGNSLNEYLQQMVAHFKDADHHPIGVDHPSTGKVYLSAPNTTPINDFAASHPAFQSFLQPFSAEEHLVADLRNSGAEDGFYWGKCALQETKKHPTEYIWVLQKKKKGWLARLFGK